MEKELKLGSEEEVEYRRKRRKEGHITPALLYEASRNANFINLKLYTMHLSVSAYKGISCGLTIIPTRTID